MLEYEKMAPIEKEYYTDEIRYNLTPFNKTEMTLGDFYRIVDSKRNNSGVYNFYKGYISLLKHGDEIDVKYHNYGSRTELRFKGSRKEIREILGV